MKLVIFLILQAVADAQSPVTSFGGVPVFNYEQEIFTSGDGEKKEWIIMSKRHKPTSATESVCQDAGECTGSGNPDAGGFGFVTVKATVKELEELASKHKDDLDFIEPSMPIQAFPIDFEGIEEHDYNVQPVKNFSFLQEPTRLWGLDRIDDASGLDGDYNPPGDGEGVHVYVLDTGILTKHTEFEGRAIPFVDTTGSRLIACNPSDHTCSQDTHVGHGTHCAGTVGGKRVGVAKKVTLYSGKVLGPRGGSTQGIVAAMDHVVRNAKKPAVISMSLGGPGQSNAFKVAIDEATAAGITVVVAAGNMNNDACRLSPAFVPNAFTVGATDDTDTRATFSSYGPCLDIYAPGVQILSAVHQSTEAYAKMDGTSMACPHVSGAAALILAKNPSMTPASLMSKLKGDAIADIISDPMPRSPNLLLNVGQGKGGGKGNNDDGKKSPSPPGCPRCKCDESRRRRQDKGGKGGKGGRRRKNKEE